MINYLKNHKITLGLASFLLVIIVTTVISIVIQSNSQQNSSNTKQSTRTSENASSTTEEDENAGYGPQLVIKNWSDNVKNVPDDERDLLEAILYSTLAKNLPPGQNIPNEDDVKIRPGSYSQTYDPDTQIYSTEFLVDIPSVQQTYRVASLYSDLPRLESGLKDYTALVLCPTESELIWAKFDCLDRIRMEEEGIF